MRKLLIFMMVVVVVFISACDWEQTDDRYYASQAVNNSSKETAMNSSFRLLVLKQATRMIKKTMLPQVLWHHRIPKANKYNIYIITSKQHAHNPRHVLAVMFSA